MPSKRLLQTSQFQLEYVPNEVEGECVILALIPLQFNLIKFVLYILLSILTLGILPILTFWHQNIKRKIVYDIVSIQEATHICIENYDNQVSIVQKQKDQFFDGKQRRQMVYFTNRYLKYFIKGNRVQVSQYSHARQRFAECMVAQAKGWSNNEPVQLTKTYGPGAMVIKKPTICDIFINEVFRPLYLFIIFNLALQIEIQYYLFCIVLSVSCVGGITITIYQVLKVNDKIFEMAFYEVQLNVLRGGSIVKISSLDIVPGDIVFLNQTIKIPFQAVLLQGQLLINECALTGQSVPVAKKSEILQKYHSKQPISKSCYLYEGTTIVQINSKKKMRVWQKYRQQYGVPVCVTQTNFTTLKGQLIRKILYPNELQNKFQTQSNKFLIFLFTLSFISYIFIVFRLASVVSPFVLIKRGLDLVTVTVTPTLPISMVIGIIYAVEKLKKKDIFTISPNQIIVGGQLQVMCFDKTGTLTHDHMNFKALLPAIQSHFQEIIQASYYQSPSAIKPQMERLLANMASNHTVVVMESTKEVIGDPMQIKLLNFSECQLVDKNEDSSVLFAFQGRHTRGKVYQRYDFESSLQRMSVIATISDNHQHVFTKGSPQVMLNIMKHQSIPTNYKQKLRQFASSGFRILAIASKRIQQWKGKRRDEIESELQFNGFEIFENGLKDETKGAIRQLRINDINPIMITGDNPITAANIGYQSNILDHNTTTLIVDYNDEKGFSEDIFKYNYEGQQKIDELPFRRPPVNRKYKEILASEADSEIVYADTLLRQIQKQNYNLCLTGKAFNRLFKQLRQGQKLHSFEKDLLLNTQILARTKPSDKAKVVKLYQVIGKIVGMCGDGANDCDALHQANIGLSLSDTEASIAAAFTSKNRHIGSMVQLIKESRAGLTTNFSLFNIIGCYALTQYSSCVILQYFYSYPSDFQFVYWDLFLNIIFVFLLGNIATAQNLTKQRPPSSLFSVANLTQLLTFYTLQLCGQILAILAMNGPFSDSIDYYQKGGQKINSKRFLDEGRADFLKDSPESNAIFLVTNFFYLGSVIAFTVTKPWKKEVYTYWPFIIIFVAMTIYTICLVIIPQSRFSLYLLDYMTSSDLNYFLLCVGLGIGILIFVIQRFVYTPLFAWMEESSRSENESIGSD